MIYVHDQRQDLPLGQSEFLFAIECSSHTVPFGGVEHVSVKCFLARRIGADSRGAPLGKGARYSLTNVL
jgi:hypothetical protein